MAMQCTPLTEHIGAQVTGIDLSAPLSAQQVADFEAAMDRYAVLVFRNQPLDQGQQIQLAQSFGPLDLGFRKIRRGPHRFSYDELADISNVTPDGELADRAHSKIVGNVANQLWHSDSSFQQTRAKYSMLSAHVIPSFGGETEFADLRAAYDTLPDWRKKQVEPLVAEHSALHSRFMLGDDKYNAAQQQEIPPAYWPVVQTDPRSGRKILFVGAHIQSIEGMTAPEGRMLVMDLMEHATQRERVYQHQWQLGDLVVWDNTATLHRGRWYDFSERRELRRATTEEVTRSPEAQQLMAARMLQAA